MSIKQVVNDFEDVMTFGKFNGKSIEWIIDNQPSYIIWLDEQKIVSFTPDVLETAIIEDANNNPPESFFWEND